MDYFPPTFKVVAGVGSFLQVDSKKSRRLILSGPLPGPAEEVTASPVAWVYAGPDFAGGHSRTKYPEFFGVHASADDSGPVGPKLNVLSLTESLTILR